MRRRLRRALESGVVVVIGLVFVELVVTGEVMGSHVQGAKARVVGQLKRQCWGLCALVSVLVDEVAHAGQMRGIARERFGNGALKRASAVGVEQLDEATGEGAEVLASLSREEEQRLGRRGRVVEAVFGAVLAPLTFVRHQGLDVSGVFYLLAAVKGAGVRGEHGVGVEHAHGLEGSRDEERAPHMVVRDRVIIPIEAHGVLPTLISRRSSVGKGLSGKVRSFGRSAWKTSPTVRCRSSGQGRSAARVRHHASAWALRSARSRNRRAAKKLSRAKRIVLSTRPFSFPLAGATGRGSKR